MSSRRAELSVGSSLYPEILAAQDYLRQAIEEGARTLGLPPAPLDFRLDSGLPPRAFRIYLSGQPQTVLQGDGLPSGATLVRSSPLFVRAQLSDQFASNVHPWPDPVQPSLAASIVHDLTLDLARSKFPGFAANAPGAVGLILNQWFTRTAVEGFDEVSAAQVVGQLSAYSAAALLRACRIDAVAELLRGLLRENLPVNDFALIAPLLADEKRVSWVAQGSVGASYPSRLVIAAPRPDDQAERRLVIARAAAVPRVLRRQAGGDALQVWVFDDAGSWLPGGAADELNYFDAQLRDQAAAAASVRGALLLASAMRRAWISERLRPHYADLKVVVVHELPRGVPVQKRGAIHIVAPISSPSTSRRRSWL